MSQNTANISTLNKEIQWFSRELDDVFRIYFQQETEALHSDDLVPPDLSDDASSYGDLVKKFEFGKAERLVLMLALAPHLKPSILDIFFTKNSLFDRPFTEFGSYANKNHAGFLPTGETVDFVLSKGDLAGRFETIRLFDKKHPFATKNILKLENNVQNEPELSGLLTISEEYLSLLTTGKKFIPENSDLFPAQYISTSLEWEDLVLSPHVLEDVRQVEVWIKNESALMADPHFKKHIKPGFRSLFYGPPGTGKTLTACLLAKSTGLDVYRVDLSLIVSKFIGETEKNLSKVFDYAEKRNWILFFDEADAIFGKRTQANSSNDRYANQEVSYLLQRVESFPGVVILASNLKSNIDEAFARRFQSIIYFPMPDESQRYQLWQNLFNGEWKMESGAQVNKLADRFELSGGSMINIYRYSVLQAVKRQSKNLLYEDVLMGIRKELSKYGKTI